MHTDPANGYVLSLQRQAGNTAVTHMLQRAPAGPLVKHSEPMIISQIWRVRSRDVVAVATGFGDQVVMFYRRSGMGDKGAYAAVAPEPGKWTPFKGLMEFGDPKRNAASEAGKAELRAAGKEPPTWFNKQPYYTHMSPDDTSGLVGYGSKRNKEVGKWLDDMNLTEGTPSKSWQAVEVDLDQAKARYQSVIRSQPGSAVPGAGHAAGGAARTAADTIPGGWHAPEAPAGAGRAAGQAGAAEAKAVGAEAKAAGVEVKGAAAGATALKGEAGALEAAGTAAKAGRLSALGALLLELALPGPLDVFFLYVEFFGSIAEAKAKLKNGAYATGFAQGMAAAITGTPADEATEALMYKTANPSIGERVAGWEGVRERGTNEGVHAGWKFGHNLDGDQRNGWVKMGFAKVKAKKQSIKGDFGRDDLIAIGIAIRPTVIELLAEAERQAQLAAAEEELEARRDMLP